MVRTKIPQAATSNQTQIFLRQNVYGSQIFKEYQHEVSPSGQPGAGDYFLRWLLQNWANPARCEAVTITSDERGSFKEYPHDPSLADFDPSDHKFVAVANASRNTPEILNAVDSDWWVHGQVLERNQITITHLCSENVTLWEMTKTQK